jgi:hypothetical protein
MKYFIKTSPSGVIRQYSCSDAMFEPGWIEVDSSYEDTVGQSTLFRHTANGPVDTGVSFLPPQFGYVFDDTALAWVDGRTAEEAWADVRAQRNTLLQQSDWTQLPDVPLETKEAWATYRQALRDVTDQPDPFNIVWPVAPGSQS